MHDRRTVLGGLALGALGVSGTTAEAGTISGSASVSGDGRWKDAFRRLDTENTGGAIDKVHDPYEAGVRKILTSTQAMFEKTGVPERWRPFFMALNERFLEIHGCWRPEVVATLADDSGVSEFRTAPLNSIRPSVLDAIDAIPQDARGLFERTIISGVTQAVMETRQHRILQGFRLVLVAPILPHYESRSTIPDEVMIHTFYRRQSILPEAQA